MKMLVAGTALLALSVTACSSTLQTASISEAYKKYERQDYAATLELIVRAENAKEMHAEQRAEITYLKAQTYEQLEQTELAETLYRYIDEQHEQSQYAYLSRLKLEEMR